MKKGLKLLWIFIFLFMVIGCESKTQNVSTLAPSEDRSAVEYEPESYRRDELLQQKLDRIEQIKTQKQNEEEENARIEKQKEEEERIRQEKIKVEEERKKKEKEKQQQEKAALASSNMNTNINKFVNDNALDSNTNYLIWVNKGQQQVYVFTGSQGQWKLLKAMACSTGAPGTPTPSGIFTINGRGDWFINENGVGAESWTRFYGNYLFHSVIMDKNHKIIDPYVGTPKSHGCIRLLLENAKWINKNISDNTKVIIN